MYVHAAEAQDARPCLSVSLSSLASLSQTKTTCESGESLYVVVVAVYVCAPLLALLPFMYIHLASCS